MLYLIGIDESGRPDLGRGRYYILVGMAYDAEFAHDLRKLTRKYIKLVKERYNIEKLEELKGKELYDRIKGSGKEKFIKLVGEILHDLVGEMDAFTIAIVIDKYAYREEFVKVIERMEDILVNPPSNYLNVLSNERIRNQIINEMYGKPFQTLVRSQALNELFYRLNLELGERESLGLMLIDSDATTLISSAYDILGSSLVEGVSAKGRTYIPENLITILLNDSKLEPGIQIADLIAYSIQRCYSDPDPIFIEPLHQVITKPEFYKVIPVPKEDPCKQGG